MLAALSLAPVPLEELLRFPILSLVVSASAPCVPCVELCCVEEHDVSECVQESVR